MGLEYKKTAFRRLDPSTSARARSLKSWRTSLHFIKTSLIYSTQLQHLYLS